MESDPQRTGPENQALASALEAFSRDLLALVRSVRVYPPAHPFLQSISTRLATLLGASLPSPLALGMTSRELILGGRFFGGKATRAAELAAYLHGRKLLRVTWQPEARHSEVIAFAQLLGDPKLAGEELGRALRSRRVFAIDVEPLVLERIHDTFQEAPRGAPQKRGGREAWQWLQSGEPPPEQVAELLASDGFWEAPLETEDGPAGGPRPAEILFRMGERLAAALECLPASQRHKVVERLARVGREISPRELAGVLEAADSAGVLDGPIADVVEQTFGGDKLVDLLAGLVEREGRNTHRLAEVYGRLASGNPDELLDAVKARLSSGEKGGFTVEVWAAVEDFLLGLQESSYMAEDYSSSLEAFAAAGTESPSEAEERDFPGDVDGNLDQVLLGLLLDDADRWGASFLDHLEARLEALSPARLLAVLDEADQGAPGLLDSRPALLETIFRSILAQLRELDPLARRAFLALARTHDRTLLDPVLRTLAEEESISVRRFLVDVVAALPPAATPALVSRMRSAPWYVTRNLAIALGRKGEDVAVPILRELLGHEHPKVRREAILALGGVDAATARDALREVAKARHHSKEDQALAARALGRGRPGEARP